MIPGGGVIIMSGSTAFATNNLVANTLMAPGTVTFTIGDLHNQPMPAGTTVTLTANNGTIVGPSSYTVGCTSFDGPLGFSFLVDADATSDSGAGVLEVSTPGPGVGSAVGVTTVYFITIDD